MSLVFNDTVNYRGIVQMYEKEIGANRGDIANNVIRLKEFTAECNNALDEYTRLAISASGRWKFDDSNHTDYPEIVTDLVANQRSYTFTVDQQNNIILDIYRVYVKDAQGKYQLIQPIDPDTQIVDVTNYDGANTTGFSYEYDKTANAILINNVPPANVVAGLKVSINREASYFTHTDTTKKAGIYGLHHKYLYLKPALEYARRNTLTSHDRIERQVLMIEREIKDGLNRRAKDERRRLVVRQESNR
jgi:hypothetical protein